MALAGDHVGEFGLEMATFPKGFGGKGAVVRPLDAQQLGAGPVAGGNQDGLSVDRQGGGAFGIAIRPGRTPQKSPVFDGVAVDAVVGEGEAVDVAVMG